MSQSNSHNRGNRKTGGKRKFVARVTLIGMIATLLAGPAAFAEKYSKIEDGKLERPTGYPEKAAFPKPHSRRVSACR